VETLDLTGNRISSVQVLQRLSGLKTLKVGGNLLTQEQLDEFRAAMPDCEVITDW
jgi:Leucine-rich repeat (LRR) protein